MENNNQQVRRNQNCPCNSGKRYKRCCGVFGGISEENETLLRSVKRKQAEDIQRRLQQGWSKPIISAEVANKRVVNVGNRVYTGDWKTFHDFLYWYLPVLFGREWYDEQVTSKDSFIHPLISINQKVTAYRAGLKMIDGYVSAPFKGAVAVYMWLSYNLYLISHNAELLEYLINRLKKKDQFAGAYYETFVTAIFIKAGFEIEFEDETNRRKTHCEFTATHKQTGKKYSVEAKLRTRKNILSCDGSSDFKLDFGRPLFRALNKHAEHERIIFIDLNLPFEQAMKYNSDALNRRIRLHEKDKANSKDPKSAYLFITNYSYHYDLDGEKHGPIYFLNQINMPDFRFNNTTLKEAIDSRKRHFPIHKLWESICQHVVLPETFDGSLPEFEQLGENNTRLLFGEKYEIVGQDGSESVVMLLDGVVDEKAKTAHGVCRDESGKISVVVFPLSDNEIQAYHRSPDTFFGQYKEVSKEIKSLLDAFDFAKKGFQDLTKEDLVERLSKHFDKPSLMLKSREELHEMYCIGMANV